MCTEVKPGENLAEMVHQLFPRTVGVQFLLLAVLLLLAVPSGPSVVGNSVFPYPQGELLKLQRLRLNGGGTVSGVSHPLTKLGMAASEGAVVIPSVLTQSGDDNDNQLDDADADCHTGVSVNQPYACDLSSTKQAFSMDSKVQEWTAEEMQQVQDEYAGSLLYDPHLAIISLTQDITKQIIQAGERGPATPISGETVFFHYELYYEDSIVASSRVRKGLFQPAVSAELVSRGRERAEGWEEELRDDSVVQEAWDVILRNMTRGERALVIVSGEERQRELLHAPFMAAASNLTDVLSLISSSCSSVGSRMHVTNEALKEAHKAPLSAVGSRSRQRGSLTSRPLRVLVEVLAFGRELFRPPVPWPAAWLWRSKLMPREDAGGLVQGVWQEKEVVVEVEEEAGEIAFECVQWGRGECTPDFGDEVLLRVALVEQGGGHTQGDVPHARFDVPDPEVDVPDEARETEASEGESLLTWVRLGDSDVPIGCEYAVVSALVKGSVCRVSLSGAYLLSSRQLASMRGHTRKQAAEEGSRILRDMPVGEGGSVLDVLDATAPWNAHEGEQRRWRRKADRGRRGKHAVYQVEVVDWNDVVDCACVCAGCTTWPDTHTPQQARQAHASSNADISHDDGGGDSDNDEGRGGSGSAAGAGAVACRALRGSGEQKKCENQGCQCRRRVLARRRGQAEHARRRLMEADEVQVRLRIRPWRSKSAAGNGAELGETEAAGDETMKNAGDDEALNLSVQVGAGQVPLCVELAMLHCTVPGSIEVMVAANDSAFCALGGKAHELVGPLLKGMEGGVAAWIFEVEAFALLKRATNLRSAACLDAASNRLQQGRELLMQGLHAPALHKFAAARCLLGSVRAAAADTQFDSEPYGFGFGGEAQVAGKECGVRGEQERRRSAALGNTERAHRMLQNLACDDFGLGDAGSLAVDESCCPEPDEDCSLLLNAPAAPKQERVADAGDTEAGGCRAGSCGSSSSDWLWRDPGPGWGDSAPEVKASSEEGRGGGRDWLDRSCSTAGSGAASARGWKHKELSRSTWLNAAACLLKLQLPAHAEVACGQLLSEEATCAKALFRRGQARAALGRWEEAEADMRAAMLEVPNSIAIKSELRKIQLQQDAAMASALPGLTRLARHKRGMYPPSLRR